MLKQHREFHQQEFQLPFTFVIVAKENGEVEERVDIRYNKRRPGRWRREWTSGITRGEQGGGGESGHQV